MIRQRIKALAATVATAAMLLAGATPAMAASGRPAFTDLAGTAHVEDVTWAAGQGIIKGYNDGTFGGMRDVVRQDMAAFLYRLAGSPDFDQAAAERANKFSDVTPAISHYKEVLWLATTGITKGYGDGTFGVMRTVVRQDMAAFLHRYATNVLHAAEPGGQAQTFPDVNATTSHYEDIIWLSRTSITTGYNDGTFGGMRTVVRQDMAAFLHRTHDNLKVEQQVDVKVKKVFTSASFTSLCNNANASCDTAGFTTYAIDQSGAVWAWGYNGFGQIGDGTTNNRTTPYKVPGLPKATNLVTKSVDISPGSRAGATVYVLGEDGSLWTWGDNTFGQVGDGTSSSSLDKSNNRTTPYKVPGLPKVTNIITTGVTAYAIGEDGSLWAWGSNQSGQVGDGTTSTDYGIISRSTPYKVTGLPKIANVTASEGITPGDGAVYVTGEDGSLWAWGSTLLDAASGSSPAKVSGLSQIANVIADRGTTWAIGTDGSVWTWGSDGADFSHRGTPYKVPGLPHVTDIALSAYGDTAAYAIAEDGSLWAWNGSDHSTPTKVNGLPKITSIVSPSATYAIGDDGTLWAWGYNGSGQVGDGTTTDRETPVKVNGLPKITNVISNGSTAYATGEDGSLWTWGGNNGSTPVKVNGLSKTTTVTDSYAIDENGALWSLGVTPTKVQFWQ